jgi:SMODS-associated and fused to various effectors sensor domain/CHAT domain
MNKKIKILFLAADPSDIKYHLRLGTECSKIKREIELEANRDRFEVTQEWAVTPHDLLKALRRYRPNVVHFSGHGGEDGIILENDLGNAQSVPRTALAELFGKYRDTVRIVFLNACYTAHQVQAFRQVIDFSIGMRKPVGDKAAITFASAFYSALSYGHPVREAFNEAKLLLKLNRDPDKDNPKLFTRSGVDDWQPFPNHASSTSLILRDGRASRKFTAGEAGMSEEPKICLWIHGWIKRLYDCRPTVELDWTEYFHRDAKRVPGQRAWKLSLFEDIQRAKGKLDGRDKGTLIDFRGKLPLTALLAVGSRFPEVGGYRFRAEQPTRGRTVLWRSDAAPSKRKFEVLMVKQRKSSPKRDILIALSITGSARDEVVALYKRHPDTFSALIYAEPNNGPGDGALRSDKDATALAIHAKELIRKCKLDYKASQVHLVVYGPGAYCLFLGQRLNAVGTIITYERALSGDYNRSVTLQTG